MTGCYVIGRRHGVGGVQLWNDEVFRSFDEAVAYFVDNVEHGADFRVYELCERS